MEQGKPVIDPPCLEKSSVELSPAEHHDWEHSLPWLAVVWAERRKMLRVTGWSLVAATLLAFVLPTRYTSTVSLMPPDQSTGSKLQMLAAAGTGLAASTGLPGIASELLGSKASGAVFIGVLSSRSVRSRLVERFDLRREYGTRSMENACKKLGRYTDLSEEKKSGIISIKVTDSTRQRAAQLAGAYVEELNRTLADLNTSAAHRERVFLEQRLQTVKQELDTSAKALSEFSSKNLTFDPRDQGKAMLDATTFLQARLIAAESQLRGLEQIYTDRNTRVRALRAQVEQLRNELNRIGGVNAGGPSTGDFQYPSVRQLPLLGVQYADLYRRTKVQEIVFELLTKQYELAKVEEAKEIPSVKVLDSPNVPERKSFPPRLLIIVGCTLLACLATSLWILFRHAWSQADDSQPFKSFLTEAGWTARAAFSRWRCRLVELRQRLPWRRAEAAESSQPGADQ